MNPKWNFDTCHKTNRQVSPSSSYLFSSNDNPLLYLVREAVQNSLDAKLDKNSKSAKPVKAIISINPMPANFNKFFTSDLIDRAIDANIIKSSPSEGILLSYEDCHTSGLTGDHNSDDAKKDSYAGFAFFEGTSNKQSNARGKFGIGKQVFVMLSGLNSYFVLSKTNVSGEPEFLFGISTLDFHTHNNNKFEPFGYWGLPRKNTSSNPLPITYKEIGGKKNIDEFRDIFMVKRSHDESGTSIVVPFADMNYSKDIDRLQEDVISIILNEYLIPVMSNDIVFEIHINRNTFTINSGNIKKYIIEMKAGSKKVFLEELYKNASFTLQKMQDKQYDLKILLTELDVEDGKFIDFVSDEKVTQNFISLFNNPVVPSLILEVKFPLSKAKNPPVPMGRMIICVSKGYNGATNPYYIRNGLVISHANLNKLSRGLSALVFIPEFSNNEIIVNELSNFLNSCENPAHTSWSTSGDQFKRSTYSTNKTYSEGALRTVKQFVFQLEKLVTGGNDVVLKSFFTELFEDATNKPGLTKSGAKGGAKKGSKNKSSSFNSELIYNELTKVYTLEIDPLDAVRTVKFNYLNRDYSKSVYTNSQFAIVTSNPSSKDILLTTSNIKATIVSGNTIDISLIKPQKGLITLTGANEYKILGVELIK